MKSILIPGLICGVFLLTALFLFITAIRKKRMSAVYAMLFCLVIAFLSGGYTAYRVLRKGVDKVGNTLKGRDAVALYSSAFGFQPSPCVEIFQSQDPVVPVVDPGIFLHFKACPEEIQKIVRSIKLNAKESVPSKFMYATSGPEWFKPTNLGDTISVYKATMQEVGWITLYVNETGTEAFYQDLNK